MADNNEPITHHTDGRPPKFEDGDSVLELQNLDETESYSEGGWGCISLLSLHLPDD